MCTPVRRENPHLLAELRCHLFCISRRRWDQPACHRRGCESDLVGAASSAWTRGDAKNLYSIWSTVVLKYERHDCLLVLCPISSRCLSVWMQSWCSGTPTWQWAGHTSWPSSPATVKTGNLTAKFTQSKNIQGLMLHYSISNSLRSRNSIIHYSLANFQTLSSCIRLFSSHFLYPNKNWKSGDNGEDEASSCGDGKYELLSVANKHMVEEIKNVMCKSKHKTVFAQGPDFWVTVT